MSVPVLSRLLIGDRTTPGREGPTREAKVIHRGPRTGPSSSRRTRPGPPLGAAASHAKPGHPNPQSQSLSRSYGSNLPTSLTYIILSTRGCSPWRPAADMGTDGCESAVTSPGFSRSRRPPVDAARTAALFARPKPILPARGFQGLGGLCRKENSSQGSGGRLLVASRCHDGYEGPNGSATRFWNMDQIPFRPMFEIKSYKKSNNCTRLPPSLRTD